MHFEVDVFHFELKKSTSKMKLFLNKEFLRFNITLVQIDFEAFKKHVRPLETTGPTIKAP